MNELELSTMIRLVTRIALACLVATQVVGCASYKQGVFPNTGPKSGGNEEAVEIHVGSEVQIETTDGESVSGEIIRVSESALTIGGASNYGFEERTFNREQIAYVRVKKESAATSLTANTLGVVIISFVVLMVLAGPK